MIPCLSQVCSLASPFGEDIADYAAGQCRCVELWLGKLEGYLDSHTPEQVRRLLDDCGVSAPVASYQGGLFAEPGPSREAHLDHFRRRLETLAALGVTTLIVAGDIGAASPDRATGPDDVARVSETLAIAAERAAGHGLRLALEFQGRATWLNNLESAAALVAELGRPNLGLCLDLFHYYTGPSKFEDLSLLSPENLFHVQLCDLLGRPREWAADADRILPGDGDFQIGPILDQLRANGYAGPVSIELFNPQLWQVPARQFGEIALTALRVLLGQASMT